MQDTRIANFYLANLEMDPFMLAFDKPIEPQWCIKSKSYMKAKVCGFLIN